MSQHDFSESRAVGGWNRRTEDWLFLETSTPSETMAGQEGRVPFSTSIYFLAHAEFSFLFFQISFFLTAYKEVGFIVAFSYRLCFIGLSLLLCCPH